MWPTVGTVSDVRPRDVQAWSATTCLHSAGNQSRSNPATAYSRECQEVSICSQTMTVASQPERRNSFPRSTKRRNSTDPRSRRTALCEDPHRGHRTLRVLQRPRRRPPPPPGRDPTRLHARRTHAARSLAPQPRDRHRDPHRRRRRPSSPCPASASPAPSSPSTPPTASARAPRSRSCATPPAGASPCPNRPSANPNSAWTARVGPQRRHGRRADRPRLLAVDRRRTRPPLRRRQRLRRRVLDRHRRRLPPGPQAQPHQSRRP